jgi:hypothetical protein
MIVRVVTGVQPEEHVELNDFPALAAMAADADVGRECPCGIDFGIPPPDNAGGSIDVVAALKAADLFD